MRFKTRLPSSYIPVSRADFLFLEKDLSLLFSVMVTVDEDVCEESRREHRILRRVGYEWGQAFSTDVCTDWGQLALWLAGIW